MIQSFLQQMKVLALRTHSSAHSPLTPIPVVDVVKLPLCSSICRLPHRMAGGVPVKDQSTASAY